MLTLILPGFSIKNKEWSEETRDKLGNNTDVYYWKHWETDQTEDGWIEKESQRIVEKYRNSKINIIAKSIGTAVVMQVYKSAPEKIYKIVLCGVPILDFLPGTEEYYSPLANIESEKILIIQNKNDNHGSYAAAEKFLHGINPRLKIISKPRDDHKYPYFEEFHDFLSL